MSRKLEAVSVIEDANKEEIIYEDVNADQIHLEENCSYISTARREPVLSPACSHGAKQKSTRSKTKKETDNKNLCLLVTVIMMAVIMSLCFVATFVEIAKMKSEFSLLIADSQVECSHKINAMITDKLDSQREYYVNLLNFTITEKMDSQREYYVNLLNFTITEKLDSQREYCVNLLHFTITDRLDSQEDYIDMLYAQLNEAAEHLTQNSISALTQGIGAFSDYLAPSCAAVLLLAPSSPSGYYWIRSSSGSAVSVYCDMTRSCGNITGGWMRVAELDMTDNSSQCPSDFRIHSYLNIRTCVGTNQSASCSSVIFPTTVQYSMVCGKIIAYQIGTPDAFAASQTDIDTPYVDGVSLTHGSPRQHIWTFAAAHSEANIYPQSNCPCFSNSQTTSPPATPSPNFVGTSYFCDTGSRRTSYYSIFYSADPLWDGAGCEGINLCCSFNNPPWFYKELPQPTSDDIEIRVCRDEAVDNEDIAIEKVEIYVR